MASFVFELALLALFYSPKTETHGQIITVQVELHTTVDLPCGCPICPKSTALVQWYRSSNSGVFIKDGKTLASWSVGTTRSSQGFGITDDFSMRIYNLTDQHNQELYRCILTPVGGAPQCTHDFKLGIYANPDTSPVIEYIRLTHGFNVTCSISNVFPMTFPILTSKEGNGTAYINRNITDINYGTFNTTVTRLFSPNKKDTTIECLYSYFNFKSMSSLRIVDRNTVDQNTTRNTDNTDCRPKPSGLWMVWIILITEVLLFIVIVYAIKTGRVLLNPALRKTIRKNTEGIDRDEHDGENSKEEKPAKSGRNLLFGKLSCVVITLTIQITVLIFLVTYLATAGCSIETCGKLEGNVSSIKVDD